MKLIAVGILLATSASALADDSPRVQDTVDRFTGERTIKYEAPMPRDVTKPKLSGIVGVSKDSSYAMIHIAMMSWTNRRSGSSWRYLNCHGTNFLLDGRPLQTQDATHNGSAMSGGVLEFVHVRLTHDQFREIGQSKSVEYRICRDEFKFTGEDIAGFKAVSDLYLASLGISGQGQDATSAQPPTDSKDKPVH